MLLLEKIKLFIMRKVAKTKKNVPIKYLSGAKNKKEQEKEILETRAKYKAGKSINIKKVSKLRAEQGKSKAKKKATKRKR